MFIAKLILTIIFVSGVLSSENSTTTSTNKIDTTTAKIEISHANSSVSIKNTIVNTTLSQSANKNVTSNSTSTQTTTLTTTTPVIMTNTTAVKANDTSNNCDCNKNGVCKNNKCICIEGYTGDKCEYMLCKANDTQYSQCSNNGECVKHYQTQKFSCLCKPSHMGALCEKPKCLDYCYNGGKCSFLNNATTDNLKCECDTKRYSGDRCEFDACIDKSKLEQTKKCPSNCYLDLNCKCNCNKECDSLYCKNNGVCVENKGKLECKCNIGFSGPICAVNECKGYCFNDGKCITNNSTNSISCECASGFNGTRCGTKIAEANSVSTTASPINNETTKKERSSMRSVLYGFTITLFICLSLIGVYYAIQKDYFKNTYFFIRSFLSSNNSRPHVPFARTHNNFSFNKLEDEQGIIQNETMMI